MIDLRKRFAGSGYLIAESEHDTTNIVCRFGSIYADGDSLVASLDAGTPLQCRLLKKLGTPIMDGDFGELSVRFPMSAIRDVTRIMKPRQAVFAKLAA